MYVMNVPLSSTTLQATPEKPGDRSSDMGSPVNCASEDLLASPRDPDALKSTEHIHEAENSSPPSASSETAWLVLIMLTNTNWAKFYLHPQIWWTAAATVVDCLHNNSLDWICFFSFFLLLHRSTVSAHIFSTFFINNSGVKLVWILSDETLSRSHIIAVFFFIIAR